MIDSHCHLADPAFAGDLEDVVRRAVEAGVVSGLCVVSLASEAEALQAGRVHALWPEARFALGVHPHEARAYAGRVDELASDLEAAWARMPGACAIGEIGLDYHYDLSPREIQREVFRAQVALARRSGRPVIVHTREADADTVAILREEGRGGLRGVFHCFSGTPSLAREALDLGFHLSFSGILTFPRAGALREVAAWAPGDRLLVETDCPYLAPVPRRGKRNEPAWVAHTIEALARARGVGVDVADASTSRNFDGLFAGEAGGRPR